MKIRLEAQPLHRAAPAVTTAPILIMATSDSGVAPSDLLEIDVSGTGVWEADFVLLRTTHYFSAPSPEKALLHGEISTFTLETDVLGDSLAVEIFGSVPGDPGIPEGTYWRPVVGQGHELFAQAHETDNSTLYVFIAGMALAAGRYKLSLSMIPVDLSSFTTPEPIARVYFRFRQIG